MRIRPRHFAVVTALAALTACGSTSTPSPTTVAPASTTTASTSATTDAVTTVPDTAGTPGTSDGGVGADGCVSAFDPDADYFPDKVTPEYSTLWTVDYRGLYAVLSVPDSEFPDRAPLRYVLVRCGAPTPELTGDLAGARTFTVPVQRTAINHNNGVAMLEQIGALPTVVGMSQSQLKLSDDPYMAEVLAQANAPIVIAPSGDEVDYEATLGVEPDIVIMAGYGPGYTSVTEAAERGLPAVMVSNRIEPTPLGSAEWMKFLSVFYDTADVANTRFAAIEAAYDDAAAKVAGVLPADYSAAYLCIEPDNGCEFVYAHGAKSMNGTMLATLGVTNPFADGNDAANGMTFDYEAALGRAADVDFIIDYELPDAVSATLAADSRFQNFTAFRDGNYLTYNPETYGFCRFNLAVQVDIPITDFAIGMAPDQFPDQTGRCFIAADA